MSIDLVNKIRDIRSDTLIKNKKSALLNLATRSDSNGQSYPSQKVLADDMGVSLRTANEAVRWLVKNGFLETVAHPEFDSLLYTINKDKIASISPVDKKEGVRKSRIPGYAESAQGGTQNLRTNHNHNHHYERSYDHDQKNCGQSEFAEQELMRVGWTSRRDRVSYIKNFGAERILGVLRGLEVAAREKSLRINCLGRYLRKTLNNLDTNFKHKQNNALGVC